MIKLPFNTVTIKSIQKINKIALFMRIFPFIRVRKQMGHLFIPHSPAAHIINYHEMRRCHVWALRLPAESYTEIVLRY